MNLIGSIEDGSPKVCKGCLIVNKQGGTKCTMKLILLFHSLLLHLMVSFIACWVYYHRSCEKFMFLNQVVLMYFCVSG